MTKIPSSPSDTQLEAAARWHLRLREAPSTDDQVAFSRWLREDPAHEEAWAKIQTTWRGAAQVPSASGPILALRQEAREAREAFAAEARAGRRRRFGGFGLAVAACLAVILVLALQPFEAASPRYETAADERLQVRLVDGSTVSLDSRSRLQLHFDDTQRLLVLES